MTDLETTISDLIENLNARQKYVLIRRFALGGKSGEGFTLAELGKKYNVTRERIRQIEEAAFVLVRKKINDGVGKPVFSFVKSYMEKLGGVAKEGDLLQAVSSEFGSEPKPLELHFLMEAGNGFVFHSEDKSHYPFWSSDKMYQKAAALIDKTYRHLKERKEEVLKDKSFNTMFPTLAKELSIDEPISQNYLAISKRFGVNHYGDFGLAEWPEINPKTVRDRAYLVLKNLGKPLHFRDIAISIEQRKFDEKKKVHASTVHNELIKDDRFVLVGRGIYALAEHGYLPGTAREVIARILKNAGPLSLNDLVQRVLKERLFKENTVMLNLQNKKLFQKLPDGRYHINQV